MPVTDGNIIIPNDTGVTAGVIDRTGAFVSNVTLSQCQMGDILPGGIFALLKSNGTSAQALDLYDHSQALITSIAIGTIFSLGGFTVGEFSPVRGNGNNLFYVACNFFGIGHPSAQVKAVDKTGSIQSTTWHPNTQGGNDIQAMAVSYDNQFLYFALDVGGNSPIYKHNLLTDTDLGVWLPGDSINANQIGKDIFVMQNGNILVTYQPAIAVDTWEIRMYDTNANLLHTFSLPTSVDASFIYTALDWFDQTMFWIRTFPSTILDTFYKVRISDFAQQTTFNNTIGGGAGEVPLSCPFLIQNNASISGPNLSITKSHSNDFFRGQIGATYTLTITNTGSSDNTGLVTVTETVPAGMTFVSMSGTGWTVVGNVATRSDTLAAGNSYPSLTVTVDVDSNASTPLINTADVVGTSNSNNVTDSTIVQTLSGMYKIVPNSGKTNDTVYTHTTPSTGNVKIPNPLIKLAAIGD